MKDEDTTKQQLIGELAELRQWISELEALETERKRAEEALKKSLEQIERAKQEWESTADSLSSLICLLDDRGRVIRANRTVEHWNLERVVDVRGREMHGLLHRGCTDPACYLETFLPWAWEELAQGRPAECEAEDRILKRYLGVQVRPIWAQPDKEGKKAASFAVVVVHDITERKRAEEELRKHRNHLEELVKERTAELTRANEQLQREITERKRAEEMLEEQAQELARSNAELEQFAYVASHDLQEPLRMVTSHLQLLEQRYKGKLNANADEFIAYAVDGATRMQMTIEDLLAYSRVGMWDVDFEPTDCEAVLDRTLANLQVAIEESGAVVTHDPLPTVMADDLQLSQVFQNLIGNAIKFRDEEPPRVHVSAQPEGDEWVFSVCDNGIGIDPEDADCIFEVFQRLHTWAEYPGTGIGLAICKKIVERHGGRIWVESQPGKGSTFYFTIPMRGER
jgi:signal transduction histidine kinase